MFADALGFLSPQGTESNPNFAADPKIDLDLIHMTSSPPPPFGKVGRTDIVTNTANFIAKVRLNSTQDISVIKNPADLNEPGLKIVFGLQHPPDKPEGAENIRYDLGISICNLAYSGANQYGGGFAAPKERLTHKGCVLIDTMAKGGMILDLAHVGEQTAHDAIDHIEQGGLNIPIMISHTGCAELYPHPRNTSTDMMRRVSEHLDLVGIYSMTFGLSDKDDSPAPFMDHISYAAEVCGIERVAIGTDGIYTERQMEEWRSHTSGMAQKMGALANVLNPRFPDQPVAFNTPSKMGVIFRALEGFGFRKETVEALCGNNFSRFLRLALS